MSTLSMRTGLCAAGLGLVLIGSVHAAALPDFGYGNRQTRANWPLLAILANFTDGVNEWSSADRSNYDDWVFNPARPGESVNGYFEEVSNGRFAWSRGGTILVNLDPSMRYDQIKARVGGDTALADRLFCSNIVYYAMGQFSFSTYDQDHNRRITGDELKILILPNESGGAARNSGDVTRGGYTYNADVAIKGLDHPFSVMCHELCHLFGALDLYGVWAEADLNQQLSVMSGDLVHLDAWHKMQFGWSAPRFYQLVGGGTAVLYAAQLRRSNASVLLYDPNHGVQEYFLLEYRTATNSTGSIYDRDVAGNGLVLWHVYQDANKNPIQYADVAYPDAEHGWHECDWCRSLIHVSQENKPCISPNSPDGKHSIFVDEHYLVKDSLYPSYKGESGWRRCAKCGCLYYGPEQANSVCGAGGHHTDSGAGNYRLPMDVPTLVGHNNAFRCTKCQTLFYQELPSWFGYSACPAGGRHTPGTNNYVLIAAWAQRSVLAEGAPDLLLGGNTVWTGGTETPRLSWFDGTPTRFRIAVRPFNPAADSITIEWLDESDTWVDFAYSGPEQGTFSRPYNTFAEGIAAVSRGGILHIKAGSSTESGRVTRRMKVVAYGGAVRIGRH